MRSIWKLNEASGVRNDLAGPYDLTDLNGSVGQGAGILGPCASFPAQVGAVANRLDNNAVPLNLLVDPITFVAWVRCNNPQPFGGIFPIVCAVASPTLVQGVSLSIDGPLNRWQFELDRQPGTPSFVLAHADSYGPVQAGATVLLIGTFDPVSQQIGIRVNNGSPDFASTGALASVDLGSTARFLVGNSRNALASNQFIGLVGPLGWYGRVLSVAEQNGLWNGGAGLPAELWPVDAFFPGTGEPKTFIFGTSKAGLTGLVGYTIYRLDGSVAAVRTTAGVYESPLGSGTYVASVTPPTGFVSGWIVGDSGDATPKFTVEEWVVGSTGGGGGSITPGDITNIAHAVWVNFERTLTTPNASSLPPSAGTRIVVLRGESIVQPITGLGSIADRTKLWVTAKTDPSQKDVDALFQIEETGGLLVLNGAPAATPTNASVAVDDEDAGNITIRIKPPASATFKPRNYFFDVQKLVGTEIHTPLPNGTWVVVPDVTRRTA